MITKEQALAELKRRGEYDDAPQEVAPKTSITKEQALAELERRGELPRSLKEYGEEAVRQVGRTGRGLATGVAGILDIPNLAAMGLHAAGLKETPTFYKPVGQSVQETIDEYTDGKLKPRSKMEGYADAIIEGVAPVALAPFTGGASLTSLVAKEGAKQLGKGTAKKAAERLASSGSKLYAPTAANIAEHGAASAGIHHYLENTDDPNMLAALAAGLVSGKAGKYATAPKESLLRGLNKATKFDPELYAKAQAADIPVTPATVSTGMLPRGLEAIAAKLPGSMGELEEFAKKQESAIARNMGISHPDLESAVKDIPYELAKKGASEFHAQRSGDFAKAKEIFEPAEKEAIKQKKVTKVGDIIKDLRKERDEFTDVNAQKDWDKDPKGKLLKKLEDYSYRQGGVGLKDLEQLRTKALKLRDKNLSPLGKETAESREYADVYNLLSKKRQDFMSEIAETPEQVKTAKEARKMWAEYKDQKKGLSKYVAKITDADTDVGAFNTLKRDPKAFKVVRQGLPREEWRDLAEGFIADLGDRQGRFNINSAHTNFVNNKHKGVKEEFKKALSAVGPKAVEHFDNTMDLITHNKKIFNQIANTSHTSHTTELISQIKRYGTAAVAAAGAVTGVASGGVMPLVGAVTTYAGLKYGAKLWTDRRLLAAMNRVATAKRPSSQQAALDAFVNSLSRYEKKEKEDKKGSEKKKSPHITIYATQSGRPN
jgi:hypothetical protein